MQTVQELRKFVAPEFIFGIDARNLIGRYAANLGAEKVLIVTDPGLIAAGWVDDVEKCLKEEGIPWYVFSDVTPNPRETQVMAGAEVFIRENCNSIIAVGGGSHLDCAKGIGIVAANGGHILDYEGVDEVPMPCVPLICIPSTSGAAADVSQFAIISDTSRRVKIAIVSKMVVPDLALIDPRVTVTMSRDLTCFTGMDALVHAIEAYVSNASSPITDLHALEAIRLIQQSLLQAIEFPHNLEYRSQMMLASLYAGLAFSNASLGAVHALAHSLGGYVDAPHGEANALLLDHVIYCNFAASPEKFRQIGRIFGAGITGDPFADRDSLCSAINAFKKAAGISKTLSDLGVTASDIGILAGNAFKDACLVTNPKELGLDDLKGIYERAL